MTNTVRPMFMAAFSALVLSLLLPVSNAQAQSAARTGRQAHYNALWGWLQRVDYTKWHGADGKTPEFQEGQSPHGKLLKVYVSVQAATNLQNMPNGSVIVKENYSPAKKLMAITVMHRSSGYDAAHGDWYYAKYMPNGQIAKTPPEMKSMPIAGKFKSCIECHSGADGNDYAFFND